MSNWDNVREDICEISILFNNAMCRAVGTFELGQSQRERLKKNIKRYGLERIANEIHSSDNKEEAAEKIAKKILRQSSFLARFLRKIYGLLLIIVAFRVLIYFFSLSTLANYFGYFCLGAMIFGLFSRDKRLVALLILIIFGGCVFFFDFYSVLRIYAAIMAVLCILAYLCDWE